MSALSAAAAALAIAFVVPQRFAGPVAVGNGIEDVLAQRAEPAKAKGAGDLGKADPVETPEVLESASATRRSDGVRAPELYAVVQRPPAPGTPAAASTVGAIGGGLESKAKAEEPAPKAELPTYIVDDSAATSRAEPDRVDPVALAGRSEPPATSASQRTNREKESVSPGALQKLRERLRKLNESATDIKEAIGSK